MSESQEAGSQVQDQASEATKETTRTKLTQTVEAIPEYAHTVLVPIANPETAADLLHLAVAVAHPESGKVIALIVSLGDVENASEVVDELTTIVEDISEEGHKLQVEVHTAPSVARGILDAVREFGADLTILGAEQPKHGEVKLGKIVESVMQTVHGDVLIYRRGYESEFDRVVLPIDNSFRSQVSARLALCISRTYDTPIEAMYVKNFFVSQYQALAFIESTIAAIPDHRRIKRTVIDAGNEVDGILARTDENDLIVVGFDQRSDFERAVFGNRSQRILDRAPGPVILVSRAKTHDDRVTRIWRRFLNWARPRLTVFEQDDIIRLARLGAGLNIDYVMLILVSAALATLGLMLNSAAIIIGAMLIAPLMVPLISLSSGLAIGRVQMAMRAAGALSAGVAMALLVAVALGLLMPLAIPTGEMLARGRPTLIDAAVALASGVAGAYATARKDIPAALAGVAIAAALMPPICTVGLGLAMGDSSLAYGASILFLTNTICIIAAGMAVFVYLGMSLRRYDDVAPWLQAAALLVFTAVSLPVLFQLVALTRDARIESDVRAQIRMAVEPAELVEVEIRDTLPKRVIATVRATQPLQSGRIIELEYNLAAALGEEVVIDLVVLPVVSFDVGPETRTEGDEDEAIEVTPEIEGLIDVLVTATPGPP